MAGRPSGVVKESYLSDMAFLQKRFHYVGLASLLAFIFLVPFIESTFAPRFIMLISIFAVALMGLNLLTSAYLFSVMHSAIMGVGGFSAALLSQPPYNLPFFITIPLAGIIAAATSVFFGLPSLRVKTFYLIFSTTAAHFIIVWILSFIVRGVPGTVVYTAPMSILGYELGILEQYYTFIIITILMAVAIAHIGRTPLGKALVMIGEKDYAAQVHGLSLLKYKAFAFAIAGFYGGVGGALWAYMLKLITIEHVSFELGWEMLGVGVIVGGLGSYVWGSILGALLMRAVVDLINFTVSSLASTMPWISQAAFGFRIIVFGAIIAVILILEPRGLAALLRKVKRFFDLWPFSY
ncbi:MAG TPA: branched-chain amino acid ABC transporter permease [Candidatus Caldiarchaeum subterraneum]|uniref:Branched-chain amino acid ABC transporter permease n=1 Tax=Caldiarchaeum subterraneum TaxID=311458 RepID=A0A832ZVW7_CALS0|nr:branched-chain amino acid ABC transporter permease [Aigarchaeota archaeon]HIQ29858.1 branched-chain amino acid ABC transporter permease [Candidatus Caldarchaeum subterraneum]